MKILLGLSGGVDSTYAALALKNDGHEVEAAVLKMHSYTTIDEAEESAASLGIPLHVIDCAVPFENTVVENFVSEYSRARTPNPCVICNSEVKFEYLYSYAMEHGFDAIATGHYAKIRKITNEYGDLYAVERGADSKKDQTYMLWRISQKILSNLVLPLADMVKSDIRAKTKEAGLLSAERADSQEICFIPDGDYATFVEGRTGVSEKGDFIGIAKRNMKSKHDRRIGRNERQNMIAAVDLPDRKNTGNILDHPRKKSDDNAEKIQIYEFNAEDLQPFLFGCESNFGLLCHGSFSFLTYSL